MEMAQNNSKPGQLTEIPLSVDEPGEAKSLDDKMHASKTNSLKRFFKMTNKRVTDALSSSDEAQFKGTIESDMESGSSEKEKPQPRRFHLRLGAINKNAESLILANTSNVACSSSKPGLKGSLSNYWNSVFKRTHGESSRKQSSGVGGTKQDNDNDDVDEEEEEEIETEIHEHIHTLAVSEESDDASKS